MASAMVDMRPTSVAGERGGRGGSSPPRSSGSRPRRGGGGRARRRGRERGKED
jgi:hypothetical protein